ncbi:hypothetical protein AMTRI_Chr11g153770 [Amborella trichopoda]
MLLLPRRLRLVNPINVAPLLNSNPNFAPSINSNPNNFSEEEDVFIRGLRTHSNSNANAIVNAKNKGRGKSEWWILDGEMQEIGDDVPPRERFVIPRDNLPNRRRKQMREQFMRRTRLVLKESEHEPWCRRYMELYQELRENWERLYWDEGYSKKIAQDHANYESAEDDDLDFSPNRRRRPQSEQMKDLGFDVARSSDAWVRSGQIRDKFEYDREKRMRDKVSFFFP